VPSLRGQVVFVTGASSGIGRASALAFAGQRARLLVAARRTERLQRLVPELLAAGAEDARAATLDVRLPEAVSRTVAELPEEWRTIEVLVNNAGLSRGLDPLQEGQLQDWEQMIDTNIKGLLHVDRAVLPLMIARGRGTVVHVGSIAGRQGYRGGNVYCATKAAVRALTESLRFDLLGTGVRVSTIDPGLVQQTEFSEVRFHGDRERADAVYRGIRTLSADDVAEVIVFVATRPAHVELAEVLLLPTDQASATQVHRRS
jgi:NADP-dependent 3-hydroxy acid dehydrogenase YdfG